jgi:hypothetical protein
LEYAQIAALLEKLARTKKEFKWEEIHEASWNLLFDVIQKAPILFSIDDKEEIHFTTDASQDSLGYILFQVINKIKRIVKIGSKALHGAEIRYSITKLETLGIAHRLNKCEKELYKRKLSRLGEEIISIDKVETIDDVDLE